MITNLNNHFEMNAELSDRQKEIVNVSLELIAESGIQGLTIKNLARKIGFSESAIYRHYENKIQILVAILNYLKGNSEQFFKVELKIEADAISKIEHLFLNHFRIFSSKPSIVAVIFSEEIFRNEPVLVEKVAELMKINSDNLKSIIQTGQEKGEIRKDITPSFLSVMIMGSLRMFVKQWQILNYPFDLTTKGAEFISSIKTLIKN